MTEPRGVIDWSLAERVARSLAGDGGGKRSVRQADLRRAARGCVGMVRDHTGLALAGRSPAAELLDRRQWIEANIESMRSMSATVDQQLAESMGLPGPLGSGLRTAAGAAAGVELGIASGYLAQRVLGQYDVALIGPVRPPRLLFVAPNLAEAQRRIGADRRPFLRWIALHEATHVVQFGAVSWLRPHLGALAEELLGAAFMRVGIEELARAGRRLLRADPRRVLAALRSGHWVSPLVAEPQRRTLARLQATMAVIEGYSDHVMDAIGARLGPEYARLREQVERERGRRRRNPIEALLSRLLGMEMKLRQYRQGKAFCDEVVERRGIAVLNRVWSEPEALPRPPELDRPGRWLARVA
jgi:coenzyme F420 biosynthesis associated uncharacterized protein